MKAKFFIVNKNEVGKLRNVLRKFGVSRKLQTQLFRHQTGEVRLNGQETFSKAEVTEGDLIEVTFPVEPAHPYFVPYDEPLDILFEDDYLLVLNKPPYQLSMPSFDQPAESIANRVLAYYQKQGYANQQLHFINRLDRLTSGVIVLAKHQWVQGAFDLLNKDEGVHKEYIAVTPPSTGILEHHGFLDFPIGRTKDSIIEREVRLDGRESLTEYRRISQSPLFDVFEVRLHTGRTHQVRVHFKHVGLPLIGDDLYGGNMEMELKRQALHCHSMSFEHPITRKRLNLKAPLPKDLEELLNDKA